MIDWCWGIDDNRRSKNTTCSWHRQNSAFLARYWFSMPNNSVILKMVTETASDQDDLEKKFHLSFFHIDLQPLVLEQDLPFQLVRRRHCHSFLHCIWWKKVLKRYFNGRIAGIKKRERACPINPAAFKSDDEYCQTCFQELHLQQHVSKNLFKVGSHLQLLVSGCHV